MPVDGALRAYETEGLNCAQSVLRAFQSCRNVREEEIARARNLGGGRAEGGLCGALHAALRLLDEQPARQRLRDEFVTLAGAEQCRAIRRAARIPCIECVRIAAGLLVAHGGPGFAGGNDMESVPNDGVCQGNMTKGIQV